MASIRRTAGERGRAWLVTGPLGHLYSVTVDIVLLWARWIGARALGRRFGG